MRKNWILLIFLVVTSAVVWNSVDFFDDNYQLEETFGEDLEIEKPSGEEEESEDFEERYIEFNHNLQSQNVIPESTSDYFHYCFSIHTFSLEPEENPPCCIPCA